MLFPSQVVMIVCLICDCSRSHGNSINTFAEPKSFQFNIADNACQYGHQGYYIDQKSIPFPHLEIKISSPKRLKLFTTSYLRNNLVF